MFKVYVTQRIMILLMYLFIQLHYCIEHYIPINNNNIQRIIKHVIYATQCNCFVITTVPCVDSMPSWNRY